jgi:hypothetical protein
VAKKLGEVWNNGSTDDKQHHEKKSAELKEKYKNYIAAYQARRKLDIAKERG